jgi:16S rRNA (cytidine1402-2'-O)-methyltransferase
MAGRLYLVPTPIGNLGDITFRALEVLRSADLIACEDTRHTQKLLNHYRITARTVSYHRHNEAERAELLVERMLGGETVAVVSDAGMPGISDPAFRLVERAIEAGLEISPLPGASAFLTAIAGSGLPADSIFFGGFLPSRKSERQRRLREVASIPATLAFYEAPHRVAASLADCLKILGDRRAVLARELTKVFEEFRRGSLSELAAAAANARQKGEFVILIGPSVADNEPLAADELLVRVLQLESEGMAAKAALKKAAKEFGLSRSEAYRELERQKSRR